MKIEKEDPFTKLAQKAAETFVKTGERIKPPPNLPEKMIRQKAGVFVSIHTKSEKLRGCLGTFLPTQKNIADEIITNAIAATQDPRFSPISQQELPNLTYQVDVLSQLKPAQKKDLDPKKFGLLVSTPDGRRGLLLPDLAGVKTAQEQIKICKAKAGINRAEPVRLYLFSVDRHRSF